VPVSHRPRQGGRSHYGIHNRLWVGLVDLLGVMWLQRRARVPAVDRLAGGSSTAGDAAAPAPARPPTDARHAQP